MKPRVHNDKLRMNVSCKMEAKMKSKLIYILVTCIPWIQMFIRFFFTINKAVRFVFFILLRSTVVQRL